MNNTLSYSGIQFHRVINDTNGNSRFVCHFVNFDKNYAQALIKARAFGGRKFNNKQYGGGIVFQCVGGLLPKLAMDIKAKLSESEKGLQAEMRRLEYKRSHMGANLECFMGNLNRAVWDHQGFDIGGGEYSAQETRQLLGALNEVLISAGYARAV